MNALDAAAAVLAHVGAPLHYKEITERMLARELWTTSGKTPWATVGARIAVDIQERGLASRFVRASAGSYALNPDVSDETESDDKRHPVDDEKSAAGSSMSFTDAAERILSESINEEPLHYAEITRQALERGLIRTEGRTPAASMNAMILTEIRRQEERGESPRFVRHGRGMVGLAAWLPDEVAKLIDERN